MASKKIYEPKVKECRNCNFAHPSKLGWIFCKEPIRMKSFLKKGQEGYPRSLNNTCPKWEWKIIIRKGKEIPI
jgi:hypothetical protein